MNGGTQPIYTGVPYNNITLQNANQAPYQNTYQPPYQAPYTQQQQQQQYKSSEFNAHDSGVVHKNGEAIV